MKKMRKMLKKNKKVRYVIDGQIYATDGRVIIGCDAPAGTPDGVYKTCKGKLFPMKDKSAPDIKSIIEGLEHTAKKSLPEAVGTTDSTIASILYYEPAKHDIWPDIGTALAIPTGLYIIKYDDKYTPVRLISADYRIYILPTSPEKI